MQEELKSQQAISEDLLVALENISAVLRRDPENNRKTVALLGSDKKSSKSISKNETAKSRSRSRD